MKSTLAICITALVCLASLNASAQDESVLKKDKTESDVIEVRRADHSLVRITRLETANPVELTTIEPARSSSSLGLEAEVESDEEIDGGLLHLDLWSSDTAEANLALQIGGDYINVFFAGGADLTVAEGKEREWQLGLGFGTRIPVWRVFFDLDLAVYGRLDQNGNPLKSGLAKARLGMGYRFATHFAVFAGASANLMADADLGFIGMDTLEDTPTNLGNTYDIEVDGPLRLTAWPGFYAGFEL